MSNLLFWMERNEGLVGVWVVRQLKPKVNVRSQLIPWIDVWSGKRSPRSFHLSLLGEDTLFIQREKLHVMFISSFGHTQYKGFGPRGLIRSNYGQACNGLMASSQIHTPKSSFSEAIGRSFPNIFFLWSWEIPYFSKARKNGFRSWNIFFWRGFRSWNIFLFSEGWKKRLQKLEYIWASEDIIYFFEKLE